MIKTNFVVNTNHLLALAGIAVVGVVYYRAKKSVGEVVSSVSVAVNPTNPNNVVNTLNSKAASVVDGVLGEGFNSKFDDHFFGLIDLINPLNDSDEYAKKVWGIDDE